MAPTLFEVEPEARGPDRDRQDDVLSLGPCTSGTTRVVHLLPPGEDLLSMMDSSCAVCAEQRLSRWPRRVSGSTTCWTGSLRYGSASPDRWKKRRETAMAFGAVATVALGAAFFAALLSGEGETKEKERTKRNRHGRRY
ncbi:unnamed protein product [Gadus morhua 'NCC']